MELQEHLANHLVLQEHIALNYWHDVLSNRSTFFSIYYLYNVYLAYIDEGDQTFTERVARYFSGVSKLHEFWNIFHTGLSWPEMHKLQFSSPADLEIKSLPQPLTTVRLAEISTSKTHWTLPQGVLTHRSEISKLKKKTHLLNWDRMDFQDGYVSSKRRFVSNLQIAISKSLRTLHPRSLTV